MIYAAYDPTSLFAGSKLPVARAVIMLAGSNAAGAVLARGTLLGRVTATDKYKPCIANANDGSQVPAAVVAFDVDTSSADAQAPAYFEGEFAAEKMILDASWTIQTLHAALRQNNIPIFARSVGVLG